MLNSTGQRDSNYCRETIRGLLSKTRCLSKLMDQQPTAVSFSIPFSCMSVLSTHPTLAMQADSVQLARSWLPCSFTVATISHYICAARDESLTICDRDLSARQMPVGEGSIMSEQRQRASHDPSLLGRFHAHEQGIQRF